MIRKYYKLFPLYWIVLGTLLLQQGLRQPVAKGAGTEVNYQRLS